MLIRQKSTSNRELVLDYLRSIAPSDATNGEIVARTGVRPHQQVFMITRDLMRAGQIQGLQAGHEWRFWCDSTTGPGNVSGPPLRLIQNQERNDPFTWDTDDPLSCRLGMSWTRL